MWIRATHIYAEKFKTNLYLPTHTLDPVLLSECGKAFTFGLASVGQLGHGGTKNLHQVRSHLCAVPQLLIINLLWYISTSFTYIYSQH